MENITFNLAQLHQYGSAFYEFLALRKTFFVDQLGWDIPHDDHVEMDQYDNPTAHYSLVLKDGKVVGGGRAMATTAEWGSHTYMLRDAVAGKLVGIPADIIPDAAVHRGVWECTRVVISDEITSADERAQCLSLIVDGLVGEARKKDATEMITLSRPSLLRALRKLGYDVKYIGAPYVNAEDGRRYVAMSMPAVMAGRHAATAVHTLPKSTHLPQHYPVHAPSVV
ncbi:acyl-homoserine-lactone synthase [Loktanella agnita]|uniref:acyl-homoserine-lactone synthase n=1 Tax=Loktanella agnita TaxID=287097 RepID=UPI003986BE96